MWSDIELHSLYDVSHSTNFTWCSKKEIDILTIQIGGILCPYVNMLRDAWVPAPNLIYGGLAVLGNLVIILLFILKIRLMLKSMWPKSDEYKQRFGS